jgi:PAS domain S-box-containing protein
MTKAKTQQYEELRETVRLLRSELEAAHEELQKSNSELLQLTLELEDRVTSRTIELQKSQEELKKHRDHLRELVEERTHELKKVNDELKIKIAELSVSEERFRSLVRTIPDIIYRVDEDGCFTFINDAIKKLGYDHSELIGEHFTSIILPSDAQNISRSIVLAKYKGNTTGDEKSPKLFDERRTGNRMTTGLEIRLVSKSKRLKPALLEPLGKDIVTAEVNSAGMYNVDPQKGVRIFIGTVGVIRDITVRKQMEKDLKKAYENLEIKVEERTAELKRSQAKLVETEKVAALGILTAGVAHELNNPMMGILNFIQYCLKHTSDEDRLHAILEDAEREVKRCTNIIRDLLMSSRIEPEGDKKDKRASFAKVMNRVLRLLSYRIEKEEIRVNQEIEQDLPDIRMQESHFQQVLINIMGNALDGLKTSKVKEINIKTLSDGKFIQLTISDTGCGIREKDMEKIFDPFFTTKLPGQGTGLGLSVSKGIIDRHRGEIYCESLVGRGTTFKILLPIEKELH